MSKNITLNLHNVISGEIELFASLPMAKGNRQTAPVFSQKVKITNGVATITGVQDTPADKSWHYQAIIRPDWRKCGSSEGSAQFRFFVPASVPSTVNLVDLPSAWAWTQNGTNYAWLGTSNASQSVEVEDGQIIRTNYAINPSFETNELNWVNASGGVRTQISTNPYVGSKCLQVTFAAAGTFKYVGQNTVIAPGKSYIKASVAVRHIAGAGFAKMRVGYRDHPTTGALTYGPLSAAQPITGDWSILSIEHAIPATTQHLVVIVYASDTAAGTSVVAGSSWAIDAMNISLGNNETSTPEPNYFDGSSRAV